MTHANEKTPTTNSRTLFATRHEVAEALGIKPETVSRWTTNGVIPVIRLGRLVRYDLAEVALHFANLSAAKKKGGKK